MIDYCKCGHSAAVHIDKKHACFFNSSPSDIPGFCACTKFEQLYDSECFRHQEVMTKEAQEAWDAAKHFDAEKPRVEQIPAQALLTIGQVLLYGEKKYGAYNWKAGMHWSKLIGSALRHIYRWMACENVDPESGLPHLAHAACCLIFLLDYGNTGSGQDDRYK